VDPELRVERAGKLLFRADLRHGRCATESLQLQKAIRQTAHGGVVVKIVDLPEAASPEMEAELRAAARAASAQLGYLHETLDKG
jgi:hypothetical protein